MTESIAMPEVGPVAGKACGACTLCCKLLAIAALDKPEGVWCPHVAVGKGCTIYADRPHECRKFHCGYLSSALSEDWHPLRSKIVLVANAAGGITATVDPGRSNAWRDAPFYAQLKSWSRELLPQRRYVLVRVGKRTIAILPDQDFDLGLMEPNEPVVIDTAPGPHGRVIYRARRAGPGHAAQAAVATPAPDSAKT